VGELVNEIMGRLVALQSATGGPILGQQRTDNEAGTANANGGEDDEAGDHLSGDLDTRRRAQKPVAFVARQPEAAGNSASAISLSPPLLFDAAHLPPTPHKEPGRPRMTDAIDLLDQDAEALVIAVDEAELGRRLWRLFDAPLVRRGDRTRIVHAAASCWASGRYVAMNLRTLASVSGHTRRPSTSRFFTNDLSFMAFSPNCQMDSP
jgi:hypothetical protein